MNQHYFAQTLSFAPTETDNTIVITKYVRYKLFSKLLLEVLLFLVLGGQKCWGQLFQQDFNSYTTLSNYINAAPSNGQFNAIGTSGVGAVLSINTTGSNKLRYARTANLGSYSRTTDFSPVPTSLMYRFDLTVSANSVAQTTAAVWQLGGAYGTANSAEINADTHSRIGLNWTTTAGQFSIRDVGAGTNSASYTGTQTITWIINNSGGTLTYKSPNGTYETVADDKADLWIGNTRELNEISVTTTSQTLTDLKFAFTAGAGTVDIDNILIDPVPTIPASTNPTPISSTSFTAKWTAVSGVTGYRIDVATDAGFTSIVSGFNNLYVAGQATNSFTISGAGINPGSTYYYRVRSASQYTVGEFASGNSTIQNLTTCAPSPTGSATQTFCSTPSPKISDLTATGTAIKWYTDPSAGTQYANTDPLVNGQHYYASQTIGCESSNRLDVIAIVNITPTANAGTTSSTICSNGTYVVAGSSVSNYASFAWTTTGDGTFAPNDNSSLMPIYAPGTNDKSSGSVTLRLTAIGNSPCANATDSKILSINTLPPSSTITVTNSTCNSSCVVTGGSFTITPCTGSTMTFFDNASGDNPRTTSPVYLQETAMTIYYACVNTTTGCRSLIQSLTTLPGTCPGAPAPPVIIATNSTCQSGCTPGGGFFTVVTSCPTSDRQSIGTGHSLTSGGTGSILTYFSDNAGSNPTTTPPTYNQITPITIYYACVSTTTGCRTPIQTLTTVPGTCTLPGAPTGSAAQSLCAGRTVAALTATGSNIQWYSLSSGGGALSPNTPLTTATIYYASQRVGFCESTARFAVTVTLLPAVNFGSVNLIKVNHLVISQVYGGGGNAGTVYKNDFIEIFNPTASPISVAGWSVQYASSTGTSWSLTNLSGSIAAGKYYLVQQAAGTGGTTNLPTPDAIGAIAMSTSAGKVALVNTTTALSGACPSSASIVDFIGYGNGTSCSETAVTATLTSTTAAIRADAGCTDIDNNSTDFFTARAPTPRNSATAANICPGTSIETICSGSMPGSMSATGATGGSGAFTYQWYSRSGNSCPSGTNISGWTTLTASDGTGFNTITFTPSLALTSTTSFACLITPAGSPVCGVPTWAGACGTILVNRVTGGTIAAAQTICPSGDPVPFTESVVSTGGGTLTYQWQSSTVNDFSSAVTTIGGATSSTYDAPSGLLVTTYYRRVTTSTLNTIACTANSNIITVTISAGPEINIKGLGISIPDGSSSTILSNGTDFGSVSTCLGKIIRTFTIENSGVSNLVIHAAGITLTGTDAAMFAIDGITLPDTIEIGSSTTFIVTFDPSSIGLKTATVNIANNDCNENPYNFAIQGTGLDPEIDIKGNSVSITNGDVTPSLSDHTDFGSVIVSTGFARSYTISNSGTSDLTFNEGAIIITGVDFSMFVVSGITFPTTIPPASSITFVITFTPTSLGLKTATVNVANNDCNENPYNFAIQGTGISCSITHFGAGSNIQVVCPLSPITNITYNTTGATGASFSGLPPGVNGNFASNVITTSGAPNTPVGSPFNYTVTLTGGGCGAFSATGAITVNPLPTLYSVTGGGPYCNNPGAIPNAIGLSGSQSGMNYQLRLNAAPTGATKPGTGGPISFGPQGVVGMYTVVATNATTGCTQPMTGSKAVSTYSCTPGITDPCTCLSNATTLTNGQFGETVTVNAPAGQTWTVTAVTGLYATASPAPPLAPNPILVGATMTEGPAGVYNLSGKHIDAIGYTITVDNGMGTNLSIGNTCEYPNPVITGLAPAICVNNTPITLTGNPGDANIMSQSFTINGAPATQFTPSIPGTYIIGYTVNGGAPKAFGPNDPGCTQTETQTVSVITSVTGTILGNSNTTICAGQSNDINMDLSGAPSFTGVFNIAVQSGSGIPTAAFNFTATTNGASSITIPAGNLTNTSSSPVTYKVTWLSLSDLSGCPVSSLTGSATIIVNPVPTIAVSAAPVRDVCPGGSFTFTISNPNAVPGTLFNFEVRDAANNLLGSGSNIAFGTYTQTVPVLCTINNPITYRFTPVGPAPLGCTGIPVPRTFNVRDAVAPVLKNGAALPANQTNVNTCKAGAPASPTVEAIKAKYTDNCTADASLVVNQTVNTITGTDCNWNARYTFTIKDACNNTTMVTIMHTGKDLTAPTWTTIAGSLNRTVEYCDIAALNAAQALVPVATDNCGGLVSYFKSAGVFAQTGCSHNGIITNTFVARDPCLNTSITNTQVITIVDNNGPTVSPATIAAQTLNIGGPGCTATLPSYLGLVGSALDCGTAAGSIPAGITPAIANYPVAGAVTLSQSPAAGVSVFGPGGSILPVTITATDVCGKITTRTFNVNIVDATAAITRCHIDTLTLGTNGTAFILPSFIDGNANNVAGLGNKFPLPRTLSSDNCTPVTLKFNVAGNLRDTVFFNCGSVTSGQQATLNTVVLRSTDVAGNFSECTATVRVIENTPPVFTTCPTTALSVNKDANCVYVMEDMKLKFPALFIAKDSCGPSNAAGGITYTQFPPVGSFMGGLASTTVTITATDTHINTATCEFTLNMNDVTSPVFTCPNQNQNLFAAVNSCSAVSNPWTIPTATDACSPSNGLGPITYTVAASGNTTLPDLSNVNFRTPGSVVTATFFVGVTTVTLTASDQAGNTSACSFTVTVTDNVKPVLANCSPNLTRTLDATPAPGQCFWTNTGTGLNATATDNCLLSSISYRLSPASAGPTQSVAQNAVTIGTGTSLAGVVFPTGVTKVAWIARDFSGNRDSCTFFVYVVDNILPTFTCPANVTFAVNAAGCSANVPASLTAATNIVDNCLPIALQEWDVSFPAASGLPPASGTGQLPNNFNFPSGTSTVQYRIRDAANNIAVCSFTVSIGSSVTGTIGSDATIGQNIATTSTIVFTGSGSAAPAGTQVYTFKYQLNSGSGFGPEQTIQTAVGSNVTTVPQSNANLGTFIYRLNIVTDGNTCPGAVVGQNTVSINIVVGNPSLALSLELAPSQINAGGAIEEAIVVRNIGTAPTAGTITVNATVYSTLTGLTVAQSLANATINGTPYTPTAGWTFNVLTGEFTSSNPIAAGGNSIIRIRITRGTGLLAGSAGKLNHTLTLSGGNEPAAQANDGTNSLNFEINKN